MIFFICKKYESTKMQFRGCLHEGYLKHFEDADKKGRVCISGA